jgi:hypothetical protein
VCKILELYNLRKIAQVQTAENVILKLISKDAKEQKKGFKLADKIIAKHHEVESLSHRLRQKTTVRVENQVIKNISVGDDKKSKTDIRINIHLNDRKDGKHALFDFVYSTIKNKLYQEVEKMLKIKKSMKIQTVVKYRIKKVKGKDEVEYREPLNNTKAESASSNNITEVLAKQRDNITKQINNSIDSWQVDRFLYVIISCYTVKPPRASSYIPTPAPYNNPKCGLVNIKNNDNNCFSWCMKYHQTKQVKNDDRISVLSKV